MYRGDGDIICEVMTSTGALGGGKSAVLMLNGVGEKTPPRGTPV